MNDRLDANPGRQVHHRCRDAGSSDGPGAGAGSRRGWRCAAELSLASLAILVGLGAVGCAAKTHANERLGGPARTAQDAAFHLRPFASWAAVNRGLPAHPALDPRSAAMVHALNAGEHNADYVAEGTTVFDASPGHRLSHIVCTEREWERCPLANLEIAVDARWRPSPGTDRSMVVIDYGTGKVYDLWHIATNPNGTVALSPDSSIHVGWGGATPLNGSGQSPGATGSGLSHLYGMIRIYKAWSAVNDGGCRTQTHCALAHAIPHALHVATNMTCRTYRPPAVKSDGKGSGPSCVPEGAHLFLDATANCAFGSHEPIEEAVCFALKRYGAFVTDTASSRFAIGFEGVSAGEPGGSGPSPYHPGGLKWDYYDMKAIPWGHLHVTAH
jgi:hypothetical protein